MVGFEGRENVRSTLGFLESMRPLGATVKRKEGKLRYKSGSCLAEFFSI